MANILGISNDAAQTLQFGQSQGLFDAGSKNVLYIFAPRNFGVHQRRPLVYAFDDNVVDKAAHLVNSAASSSGIGAALSGFLQDPQVLSSVRPAFTGGITTNLSYLQDWWTFLLVVNNDRPRAVQAAGFNTDTTIFSSLQNNRIIYQGFFVGEEPVNTLTMHGSQPTYNWNVRMMITHKTVINHTNSFGNQSTGRTDVVADTDWVSGVTSQISEAGKSLHFNTPGHILKNTDMQPDGTMVSLGDMYYDHIHAEMATQSIAAAQSVPTNNIAAIVKGIVSANETVLTESAVGTLRHSYIGNDLTTTRDLFSSTFTNALGGTASNLDVIGFKPNDLVTLEVVRSRYHPDVQPILPPKQTMADIIDPSENSPSSVFSSMLTQIIPTILSNAGMGALAFSYDSRYDMWQVTYSSFLYTMTDAEKAQRINAVRVKLIKEIFPLLMVRGDFSLKAYMSTGALSRCILNFYCDSPTTAMFETPTIAGGLLSNMVADSTILGGNAMELTQFVGRITNDSIDRAEHRGMDHAQFTMNAVNSMANPINPIGAVNQGQSSNINNEPIVSIFDSLPMKGL